jgi:hypothetical protein
MTAGVLTRPILLVAVTVVVVYPARSASADPVILRVVQRRFRRSFHRR